VAIAYSGQVLSYQKMLGQLTDAGNTVTLAHYLQLLEGAGMVAGLSKYSTGKVRQRGSSPKLQVLNTALMTALAGLSFAETGQDAERWGRLVESAVGAHLLNETRGSNVDLNYWRERNQEVDYVLARRNTVVGIEVKSTRLHGASGMEAFRRLFNPHRVLLVGASGIPLDEFLSTPVGQWLKQ
jgi:uncharacterized protein